MDRQKFSHANAIYGMIEIARRKSIELDDLKGNIVEILKGRIEIPQDDVLSVWRGIDKLIEHLDKEIEKGYKEIDEL